MEGLYREAVAIADQARGWFDGPGAAWRATLDIADQAQVATESLAITAQLMAIIAWVLDPRHTAAPETAPLFACEMISSVPKALAGQPGGAIAAAARRLTAQAAALTAGQTPQPQTAANLWRLS